MTLEASKNLGGAGALLIFISPIMGYALGIGFGGLLFLIGGILVLLGLKGFADYYGEGGIFSNALCALLATIAAAIIVALIIVFALAGLLGALGLNIGNFQDWMALRNFDWQSVSMDVLIRFGAEMLIGLVALSAFVLLTTVFLRRSLEYMSAKSGIVLFQTAGTLLLAGAILTIVLIGLILIWIAMLLLAIAFFSIRSQQPPPPISAATQAQLRSKTNVHISHITRVILALCKGAIDKHEHNSQPSCKCCVALICIPFS